MLYCSRIHKFYFLFCLTTYNIYLKKYFYFIKNKKLIELLKIIKKMLNTLLYNKKILKQFYVMFIK